MTGSACNHMADFLGKEKKDERTSWLHLVLTKICDHLAYLIPVPSGAVHVTALYKCSVLLSV